MSSTLRRLVAPLATSGLVLSASATAALPPVTPGPTPSIPTPPINLCASYQPTLADCQNPVTLCAVAARAKAKTDANATCNTLITQAAEAASTSLPQRAVVVPSTRNVNGDTVSPDVATKVVAFQAEDPNARTMSGLSGLYMGRVHLAQTYLPSTSSYSSLLESSRQAQRDGWNASGNVINSCSEYVYEKYYDYSVFEDAYVKKGNDYRAIYNLAYASSPRGVPASAIGTRGMQSPLLRGKDGTAINPNINFQSGLPKNEFFTVPLAGQPTKVVIAAGAEDKILSLPGMVMVTLKNLQRGLNLGGLVFNDSSLKPIIQQGDTYYNESWSWHKAMNEANAAVLDEELYEYDRMQDDFTALLRKREELVAVIASQLQAKPIPVVGKPRFYDRYWLDPVWNPDPLRVDRAARLDVNVLDPSSIPVQYYSQLTAQSATLASSATAVPTPGPYLPRPIPRIDGPIVTLACMGNQLICLFYKLEALDVAIEESLQQARSVGCLTFQGAGAAAPCDWSPKRFAQRVMNLYPTLREQNYQKCMDYTDNKFSELKSKAMVVVGKVNYPVTDYTTSPATLEQYFTRRDTYLNALSKVVGDLRDPYSTGLRLKWESGDDYALGNNTFGATASYHVSLALNNLGQNDCAMSPEAQGRFDATGRALGTSVNLIHAEAKVSNVRADVDLDVFDNSIHVVDVHKDLAGGQYNLVAGAKHTSKTFVDVSTTFVIVVVPVTLGAKVSGTVGINYSLGAEHNVTTNAAGCQVASVGVSGRLEPYASVDGELYAGVDLFIVEAGVKGKLQLVHASVPLDALAELSAGGGRIALNLAGRSDLKFTFLSGRISAYVEVGIWPLEKEFEATIVSWDGLHFDVNLFNKDVTVPLADLKALL